jgi:hypothetical protein
VNRQRFIGGVDSVFTHIHWCLTYIGVKREQGERAADICQCERISDEEGAPAVESEGVTFSEHSVKSMEFSVNIQGIFREHSLNVPYMTKERPMWKVKA